jgi:hypothetical protein
MNHFKISRLSLISWQLEPEVERGVTEQARQQSLVLG